MAAAKTHDQDAMLKTRASNPRRNRRSDQSQKRHARRKPVRHDVSMRRPIVAGLHAWGTDLRCRVFIKLRRKLNGYFFVRWFSRKTKQRLEDKVYSGFYSTHKTKKFRKRVECGCLWAIWPNVFNIDRLNLVIQLKGCHIKHETTFLNFFVSVLAQ